MTDDQGTGGSHVPELLSANERFAATFPYRGLEAQPSRQLAVVTCMDTRIAVLEALGLEPGHAHIIRNGGGLVTDDVVRSLVLSQRFLGTREIMVMQHTGCGVEGLDAEALRRELEAETGTAPSWPLPSFSDARKAVEESVRRLREDPFLVERAFIRGFVYDVATGRVEEVTG